MNSSLRGCVGFLLLALVITPSLRAQGPTVSSSSVGYIDDAIPGNMLRLRFDDSVNIHAYNRGEFITGAANGFPKDETRVDYQEVSAYAEYALYDRLSFFIEMPVRYLEAQVNGDHFGVSDINAGGKLAFVQTEETVATFQFRTYAPTGDSVRGLGTGHTTLEPALLLYDNLGAGLTLEGETRATIPLGGTPDFESYVLRYGIGLGYDLYKENDLTICPIVEFVGWTFLGGKEDLLTSGDPVTTTKSASGDTIVNAKMGVRLKMLDRGDIYFGYGRALTGSTLYKDIYRLEWRLYF